MNAILEHARLKINVDHDMRRPGEGGHAVLIGLRPGYRKCPFCDYADYDYKLDEHLRAMRAADLGHDGPG